MLRARRRAILISQLQRNITEESILLLHSFESNLDTVDLINANNLGIDRKFMVAFCGGPKHISAVTGSQFLTESVIEESNTESRDSSHFRHVLANAHPDRVSAARQSSV